MKKPEKKPKPKKQAVAVKDLTAKDATKVKGGSLNLKKPEIDYKGG